MEEKQSIVFSPCVCWPFLGWKTEGRHAGEEFSSGRSKEKINRATCLTRTADICLCRCSLPWDFLSLKGHKLLNPNREFFLYQHLHVCFMWFGSAIIVAFKSVSSSEGSLVHEPMRAREGMASDINWSGPVSFMILCFIFHKSV